MTELRCLANQLKIVMAALLLCLLVPADASGQQASPATLTVSAAISLKDALDEIGRLYEHSTVKITFNYGSSGTLQHQIEHGAPVDIFFSAAEKQMDSLEAQGLLVEGTRRDVVRNKLVLIAPASSILVKDFADLADPKVKTIALGELTTVPAGMYAQQVLQHLGLLDRIKNKIVFAQDVRQVLTYVETGNADAGLVYRTDALLSRNVRVIATAQEGWPEAILYPMAVVKNTKQESAARAFAEFLAGATARAVFEKYGFSAPEAAAGKR